MYDKLTALYCNAFGVRKHHMRNCYAHLRGQFNRGLRTWHVIAHVIEGVSFDQMEDLASLDVIVDDYIDAYSENDAATEFIRRYGMDDGIGLAVTRAI
jgi:hypothetical protein